MTSAFLDHFVDWAWSALRDSEEACSYLLGRGSSEEQWARHRIGYVASEFEVDVKDDPAHGDACFDRDKKHLRCDSCRFRLWSSSWEEDGDGASHQAPGRRLVGSLVLPLTTYSGAIVGAQVRSLEGKSYDTFVLKRRPEAYAFGLGPAVHHVWNSGIVWLVEGSFDHMVIERLVSPACFAMTTSSLSVLQTRFLTRFAKRVYWCGDLDKAGRDGFVSFHKWNSSRFSEVIDVKYGKPGFKGKDVNELWRALGDDRFSRHMRDAVGKFS